jgi:tetratricopeptide (TPR) repeat protein
MTDYRYSRYYYKPRRKKGKLIFSLLLILMVGGSIVYSVLFLDVRYLYANALDHYRVLFNDYRFLEKNLQSGNYNVVIQEGTPYLLKRPYNPRLIRYIGEAYYQISSGLTGKEKEDSIDKAIRYLRKGIVLSTYNDFLAKSYYILGMSYFKKGAYYHELAAEYLKKALDAGYKDSTIFEVLGYCYYKLGVYDQSVVYLARARESNPKDVVRLYLAYSYNGKGDSKTAMEELEVLASASKDDAILEEAFSLMATINVRSGNLTAARENLSKIFELNENSAEAHYWLGNVFEQEGDILSARKEWRIALKIDPKHIGAIEKLY